ncbi:hypothetical protein CVT26_010574 [Gymnopilus dilepis]|uniref:Aldehyde dehydrogenase n=1 Tax=Gymnopilus dilepis TaxID=231916 RepID=A0A409VZI0_9AGAR|nr:hypothetical protein CVT26_010574 [Gymnopilus dilepis]
MAGYTPICEIPKIYHGLKETFGTGLTKPVSWRRCQLLQLARFVKENADAMADAVALDLGKPKQEFMMTEVSASIERSLIAADQVAEWAKPEAVTPAKEWQKGWNPRIEKHPKGVVLIIAPWNYPMVLNLQPLIGAISAGCCALLKPSEIAPHFSSFLAHNLGNYLDPNAYRVALGGVPETTRILEFKWDHIFYTGNSRVGRIIASAAAKHLTPTTLELGSKSPVIVDSTADIQLSARRILWGKVTNAGQICVAPDYILAERSILPALLDALKEEYRSFYPEGPFKSSSYGRIVSDAHVERLKGVLGRTNGQIVLGGKWSEDQGKRGLEPTFVVDVKPGDSLLEEELFGPILPIVAVESLDEAIGYVNARNHPLVVYIFSSDEGNKRKIIDNTVSGSVAVNDVFFQLAVNELPFGGVGESGYGRQVLKYSFDNFVYLRSITDTPYADEPNFQARYPPYTKESYDLFAAILQTPIPEE